MKLQYKQIAPFLQKPDPAFPVVLVYGPDEGQVRERAEHLAKLTVPDIKDAFMVADVSLAALGDTPSLLADEAKSLSMLGGRRVVRLRAQAAERGAMSAVEAGVAALLEVAAAGDNLVIIEAGDLGPSAGLRKKIEEAKNAVALPCYLQEERDISKVIGDALRAEKYAIDRDALALMAANVRGDSGVVRNEIDKLITYMGPENRQVRLEDVQACTGDVADMSTDMLTQAAASGRFAEAERALKSLLAEGTSAVAVVRALLNYFQRLHVTRARMDKGDAIDVAMKQLKPAVFWKNEAAFKAQLASWRTAGLEQALQAIMTCEFKSKQTGIGDALLLSQLLFNLAQLSGAAARRRA